MASIHFFFRYFAHTWKNKLILFTCTNSENDEWITEFPQFSTTRKTFCEYVLFGSPFNVNLMLVQLVDFVTQLNDREKRIQEKTKYRIDLVAVICMNCKRTELLQWRCYTFGMNSATEQAWRLKNTALVIWVVRLSPSTSVFFACILSKWTHSIFPSFALRLHKKAGKLNVSTNNRAKLSVWHEGEIVNKPLSPHTLMLSHSRSTANKQARHARV